jgi:hypothetical protein
LGSDNQDLPLPRFKNMVPFLEGQSIAKNRSLRSSKHGWKMSDDFTLGIALPAKFAETSLRASWWYPPVI